VATGLGCIVAYTQAQRRERIERKQVESWISKKFATHRQDIINYVEKQEWNRFDVETLNKIYEGFQKHIPDSEHGALKRDHFEEVLKKLGINIEQHAASVESWFLFWDPNNTRTIDFLELVQGLNVYFYGPNQELLLRLFSVFDLNRNGFIDRSELKALFSAFFDKHDSKSIEAAVAEVMLSSDKNHDSVLTRSEFLALGNDRDFNLDLSGGFIAKFAAEFGLSEEAVQRSA